MVSKCSVLDCFVKDYCVVTVIGFLLLTLMLCGVWLLFDLV